MEVTALELVLLCAAALTAGFVDAIAGGGGLLTLPSLLTAALAGHHLPAVLRGQTPAVNHDWVGSIGLSFGKFLAKVAEDVDAMLASLD